MESIHVSAMQCLLIKDPQEKCSEVFQLHDLLNESNINVEQAQLKNIVEPGRPLKPNLVAPKFVPKRSLATEQGRAALIHAITHIEFNAINLALDAVYRFQNMPVQYYLDWMKVAYEEAKHFSMLKSRLLEIGFDYGDFDAHNGLWEMAVKTSEDIVSRMALIPRVLEARGLDVTPGMIVKFESLGDKKTADILRVIFNDEIGHVKIGTRWFKYVCEQQQLNPEETFQNLIEEYFSGELRGPFELDARKKAGFSKVELEALESIP